MDHGFGLDVPEALVEVCQPERLALVVYDMQVGIVPQLPDGKEVTRAVADVLDAARAGGFRVFFTRHMSLPNEVAGVSQLRTAKAWQRARTVAEVKPSFPRDSPQFQIVPELAPRASEAILDKIAMSAFVGTPLEMALRDCGLVALDTLPDPRVIPGAIRVTPDELSARRDEIPRDREIVLYCT
jgi:biuret amidohydrolase